MKISQVLAGVLVITTIITGTYMPPLAVAQTNRPLLNLLDLIDFQTITERIRNLGQYIQFNEATNLWTFDTSAAQQNGFSEVIIALGAEMVSFKNDLYNRAMEAETQNVTYVDPSLEQYPILKRFLERATQRAEELEREELSQEFVPGYLSQHQNKVLGIKVPKALAPTTSKLILAASTITDCGWWNNPKPRSSPPRQTITSSNPQQYLINNNYHRTAGYACGNDVFSSPCTNDYTRGRSYSNCSSPIFRNHAIITSNTTYQVQYGEPNPEVYSIPPYGANPGWPSIDWDVYVWWWHRTR
jgi:hypothetical protein